MASAIAFTLYLEMPRVAFETAREREQLLMDRGNQYKRAIQVYYAVNKRYPAKIEDLENTNNVRFLRRRYKNPLNGKDEWRLVHTNGSFLTDSLVDKPPAQNGQNGQLAGAGPLGANNLNTAASNTPAAAAAAGQAQPPPALNAAALARPSDRPTLQGQAQATGPLPGQFPGQFPGAANNLPFGNPAGANGLTYDPGDPRTWPAITIAPAPAAGQNGQPAAANGQGNFAAPNNGLNTGLNNGFGGSPIPGTIQPGTPLNAINQTGVNFQNQGAIPGQNPGFGGQNPQPITLSVPTPAPDNTSGTANQTGALPFTPPFNQPGAVSQPVPQLTPQPSPSSGALPSGAAPQSSLPAGGPNPAISLIGSQLSNAAPTQNNATVLLPQGGVSTAASGTPASGASPFFGQAPANGTSGGPGIAGVASIVEGPSIKSYREHLKYQEWEFVYQPDQGQTGQPVQQQNPPQNPNGAANPNGAGVGASTAPSNNPFGNITSNGIGGAAPPNTANQNPFSLPSSTTPAQPQQ